MSDYLWNLAARALDRATVVRPRLAPLYGVPESVPVWLGDEPAGDRDIVAPGPRTPEAPRETSEPSQAEVGSRTAAAPVPSGAAPRLPERETLPYEPEPVERKPGWPKRPAHIDAQPETDQPPLIHAVKRNAPAPPLPGMENPAPPPTSRRVTATATPGDGQAQSPIRASRETTSFPRRAEDPRPMLVDSPDMAARDVARPEPSLGASPKAPPGQASRPPADRPPAIPVTTARAPLGSQPITLSAATREAPAEPAPTIQVTIGRIELRATHPAERPRTAEVKPASSSLQEYLKRRARGGRE
jgi:hypothetical protein